MKIFKLFSCCIPVKGAKVSIIFDSQRWKYYYIPNSLYEIVTQYKNCSITEILRNYPKEDESTINEYIDFLINNEIGIYCSLEDIKNFPDIALDYSSSDIINNAIIDIDKDSCFKFEKIFIELELLGCKYIQIRIYDSFCIKKLLEFLEFTVNRKFLHLEILVKYSESFQIKDLFYLFSTYRNLGNITIHSVPESLLPNFKNSELLRFTVQQIINESCCGNINKYNFSLSLEHFIEAQKYNTCLNKKISIDKRGNIKNCPTLKMSYGNINNVSLLEVVINKEFQSYWGINKDSIQVCKDCQFRYICTDCRAFLNTKNEKPFKCNYNPYTNEWIQ